MSAADSTRLKILYVEDDPTDRRAFERFVREHGLDYDYAFAHSLQEARQKLSADQYDIVISDHRLGDGSGLSLLELDVPAPFIVVTGAGDESVAVEAMKRGADDYLVKGPEHNYLEVLPLTVDAALARRRAEQALAESEKRFQTMADTAPVMIWLSDADQRYTYVNKPWLEFRGRALEQEQGGGWTAGVHAEDLPGVMKKFTSASRGLQPFRREYRLQRHDGDYRWVLDSGTPRMTDDGSCAGYVGSCIDITDRKQAEHQQKLLLADLAKSHDDLMCILQQLRQGALMVDDQGRILFLNNACQKLLQQEPDQIIGKHWEAVCPFLPADKLLLKDLLAKKSERRQTVSLQLELPSGRRYSVDVEIQVDPRSGRGSILYLYDMTVIHDLRRLLSEKASFEGIVGKSGAMQVVFEQMREVAKLDATVLIEGATGTGKEMVARAIHDTGHRKDKPFVALNCAGLTESLLASQLFGHKRGAFTGAVADQLGVFEVADGGTLFLDEIGDVTPSVQTSLLRVLQEREIVRLGESQPRKVNVRILVATHRDLNKLVRQGSFREDLLYRVRVARIKLPPLCERRTDIPLLVQVFLNAFRAASGKNVEGCSDEALGLLLEYEWPGNVRELQSAVEFSAIRCKSSVIQPEDLPPEVLAGESWTDEESEEAEAQRRRITAALKEAHGNRKQAAHLLGISRATLYRRLAALKIDPQHSSAGGG